MVINIPITGQMRGLEEIGEFSSPGADANGVVFTFPREYRHIMLMGGAYGVGGTTATLYLRCNSTTAGYTNQSWYTEALSSVNVLNRVANDPGILLGAASTYGRSCIQLEGSISRYLGAARPFTVRTAGHHPSSTYARVQNIAGYWNNTADPVTSLSIYSTTTALVSYDFLLLGKR